MALPNIFTKNVADKVIERVNQLTPTGKPNWGKMNVSQMLAHCNVTYELVYDTKHPKPNFFMKFILKNFIKKIVTNEKPFKHNAQTSSEFIIKETKNFEEEKSRVINFIKKTQQLGESSFDNKLSHAFGKLSKQEWNNLFYKHIDHHLKQFGV